MSSDDLAFLNDVLAAQAAPATTASAGGATDRQVNGHSDTVPSNGNEARQAPDLASLQPILQALKISASSEADLENMSDETISALLEKLDEANLVTDGLESRLDQLLGELDGMLENLETSNPDAVEKEIESSVHDVAETVADAKEDIVDGQLVNHEKDEI